MNSLEDAVEAFREVAERILLLKEEGAETAQLDAACKAGTLVLLKLREAQKQALLHAEGVKDATNTLKAQLDLTSLQLHNLIYEKHHYQRETNANLAYESSVPDAQLALQPEDELLASLPAEQAAQLRDDPHQLMLWRLRSELQQRRTLTEQLKELQIQKQAEADKLAARKALLDDVASRVRALDAAARPIAATLGGVPPPLRAADARRVDLLPLPLYVVRAQWAAAAQAHGLPVVVRVSGAVDVAADAADAAGDAAAAGDASRMYQAHPLTVEVDITHAPTSASTSGGAAAVAPLHLRFCYWPATRLVGAWSPSSAADDAALAALFDGDSGGGEACAVLAQLADPPYAFGSGSTPGRPYRWVQELAGNDWIATAPSALHALADAERSALREQLHAVHRQRRVLALVQRLLAVCRPS